MSVERCLWTRALQRANLEGVWPRGTAARQLCGCGRRDHRLLLFTDVPLHPFRHETNIDLRPPAGSVPLCVLGTNREWPLIPNSQTAQATQCPSADDHVNKLCVSTQWNVLALTKEGVWTRVSTWVLLGDIVLSEVSQP